MWVSTYLCISLHSFVSATTLRGERNLNFNLCFLLLLGFLCCCSHRQNGAYTLGFQPFCHLKRLISAKTRTCIFAISVIIDTSVLLYMHINESHLQAAAEILALSVVVLWLHFIHWDAPLCACHALSLCYSIRNQVIKREESVCV